MSDVTAPSSTHAPIRRPRAASYKLLDAGAIAMMAILVGAFIAPTVAWIEWVQPAAAPPARPVELLMLIRAALMSLLLPIVQIGMQIRRFGGPAIRGNRDYSPRMSGAAGRIARAHANAVESLTAFAAVVLAAHALGVSNRWTIAAATLYLAARIVHAASYALGVTILRSSAFYAGWIATVTIAIAAL
jgi:uncharacterized MAPEG superfamily protein